MLTSYTIVCVFEIFRALMTHASVSPEEREKLGISDTLVCYASVFVIIM